MALDVSEMLICAVYEAKKTLGDIWTVGVCALLVFGEFVGVKLNAGEEVGLRVPLTVKRAVGEFKEEMLAD